MEDKTQNDGNWKNISSNMFHSCNQIFKKKTLQKKEKNFAKTKIDIFKNKKVKKERILRKKQGDKFNNFISLPFD